MALTTVQKFKLKKFIKELSQYRGRHTELVSVYIPQGYDMIKIIQHLEQEKGTASNIKSTATRKNVQDALERMIQHLRLFKKTPENGLAVFSGNVAEREGQSDVQVWSLEPPVPLKMRLYRCDKTFVLDILEEFLETKEVFGLVVIDRRDASIAYLKGKTIVPALKTHSHVPGKTRAGGQCLLPNTLILSSNGEILKIRKSHNPYILKSLSLDNFNIQDSPITDKWEVKKKRAVRIITKEPRLDITSSEDHTLFVSTDNGILEKMAKELKENDKLVMPEKIKVKGKTQFFKPLKYYNSFSINNNGRDLIKKLRTKSGLHQKQLAKKIGITQTAISTIELGKRTVKRSLLSKLCNELNLTFEDFIKNYCIPSGAGSIPTKLTPDLAQIIGYFCGDGSAEEDRLSFFEQNEELALYYKNLIEKTFKLNCSFRFRESKNYFQIRLTSRPVVRFFLEEFKEIKKAGDSLVPENVLKSDNKVVASFLKGIFDAEGYPIKKRGIGLGINNKILAQQIQLALLRFGIISSVYEYDNRKNIYSTNPRFSVDASEKQSLVFFKKYIGFSFSDKKNKLNNIIKDKSDTSSIRQLIIPGKEIRRLIYKAGYNLGLFPAVTNFFRNKREISKQVFKKSILNKVKDKKLYRDLKEIYNYPIVPVKIKSIQKIDKKLDMVDISVKNQNFIANGVIVHNSAMRFERLREIAKKEHFKKVGDYMKNEFLGNTNLKGILLGGPGPTKYEFLDGNFITTEVKNKIIGVKDLSYTEEFGLQELVDKSADILAAEEVIEEKKLVVRFFETLAKTPAKVAYGEEEAMADVKNGVVDILLLSEELPDEKIEEFEKEAEKYGTTVKIISTETREGAQLKDMGMIAAILRYEVHH